MDDHPKQIGKYKIEKVVGEGGMGVVYLGWHDTLKCHRAIKVLSNIPGRVFTDLVREAQLGAQFAHPNIVSVHECFEEHGKTYLVMDYLPRGDLRPYIGQLELVQVGGVLEGVLAGLAEGEKQGVIHRDIKPANLLVDLSGRVQIADYGIAKAVHTALAGAPPTAIGTPGYMAPEQILGQPIGPWTDLYSLGCVAFELITEQRPFRDTHDPIALALRHASEPVPPIQSVKRLTLRDWAEWIDQLLLKDPADRPQSAAVARRELEVLLIKQFGGHWRDDAALGDPPAAAAAVEPDEPVERVSEERHSVRRNAPTLGVDEVEPERPEPAPVTPEPAVPAEPGGSHRYRLALLSLVAVILATLGIAWAVEHFVGDSEAAVPAVKVGALLVTSGPSGASDMDIFRGAQFAQEFINGERLFADGGGKDLHLNMQAGAGLPALEGAKVQLVKPHTLPDRCNADLVVEEFVKQGVAAVFGAYSSTITLRGMAAAHVFDVPMFNAGSTVSSLTEPPSPETAGDITTRNCPGGTKTIPDPRNDEGEDDWFFRVSVSDTQDAGLFGGLLDEARRKTGMPVKKVAVLHENADIYGNGGWRDARKLFPDGEGYEVRSFGYKTVLGSGSADPCSQPEMLAEVRAQLKALEDFDPDLVMAASYPPDAVAIVQGMEELDYVPPAFITFGSGFLGERFIEDAGTAHVDCGLPSADTTGIISPATWSGDIRNPSPNATRIAELYKQRFGHEMNSRNAVGFTAMLALAQAIDEAGSTDHTQIRDALRALNVPADQTIMSWRGIQFDEHGQNTHATAVLEQIIDGRYRVVYPATKRQTEPVLPNPDAKPR